MDVLYNAKRLPPEEAARVINTVLNKDIGAMA